LGGVGGAEERDDYNHNNNARIAAPVGNTAGPRRNTNRRRHGRYMFVHGHLPVFFQSLMMEVYDHANDLLS